MIRDCCYKGQGPVMSENNSKIALSASNTPQILIGIGGTGANGIASAASKAGDAPLIIAYNFQGLLGSSTFPADRIKGDISGNGDGRFYTKWAHAITGNSQQDIPASTLSQSVSNYAENILETKGLFSSLIPNTVDGHIISTNHVFQKQSRVTSEGDVALPPEYRPYIQPAIQAYNELLTGTKSDPLKLDLRNNHQNNILLLGPYSNANIVIGDGNNIILNSPAMFDATLGVYQRGYFDTTAQKASYWSFYPSAQGLAKSNTIYLGEGNNLVYYDSSIKTIETKNGDNVFAPSFGSFNWAKNNFQTLTPINSQFQPNADNKTWFTPFTINAANGGIGVDKAYSYQDTYSIVGNYGDGFETYKNPSSYSQMTYVGNVAGGPNNPIEENGVVDQSKLPSIGGQIIRAGSGNDVFYGVDPYFYHYNETLGTGISGEGNRDVFIIPKNNTKNERFSFQNFETITMLGGKGNDIFYLGNPTRIAPDGLQYKGDYSYKISTNHRDLVNQAARESLDFAEKDAGVDIIEVNMSADIRAFTNTTQSYEAETGRNPRGADFAKAAVTGYFGAADTFLDTFTDIGASFKFMPLIDIGLSAASGISEMIKIFTPSPPPPIVVSNDVLTQPLGQWRQSVAINDWNPGTIINIKVDPTWTTMQSTGRWSNVIVNIDLKQTNIDGTGTSISWRKGSDAASNQIFFIDALGTKGTGYYSFNFKTGQYDQITNQNLDFFGTIAAGVSGINPLKNYTAKNGFVFSSDDTSVASMAPEGAYQFYWNDKDNPTLQTSERDLLNEARESSQSLSIQFDSRSLGWYWQPSYKSTLPPGTLNPTEEQLRDAISIDENASKLWIVSEDDATKWEYHTFADFRTKTEAFQDSLLAKTFYQKQSRSGGAVDADQKATKKLVQDFDILKDIMPDLNELKQNSAAQVKLSNLGQITAVNSNGVGADVFFIPDQLSGTVYKMTINMHGDEIIASNPVQQKRGDIWFVEEANLRDIDGDNVIGLSGIEAIKSEVNTKAIIESFYVSVLERIPDQEGLDFWTKTLEEIGNKTAVLKAFLVSSEKEDTTSRFDFINDLYANLLNRHADSEGAKYWMSQIEAGLSRGEIIDSFLNSEEFISLIGMPLFNSDDF